MKSLLLISILLLFNFQAVINSQNLKKTEMPVYPAYEEVIEQFLTHYLPGLNENENIFALAKKPDGWYARTVNYNDNKPIKDELYWSSKSKKYLTINFPINSSGIIDDENKSLQQNYSAITFSAMVPYWGYEGWENDVIKEFANKDNLSDTLLNALARAYSSSAKNILNFSEFGNPGAFRKLPNGQNALNPDILAQYLKYQHLANNTYSKLYKQNPLFETFVSSSFNVYSNEIMNGFLTLRYFQNEETAKKELKTGLYDDFYLEMARNYLNSCDLNAVLFTNGDMDTYPLLYVQETENFRKDVLVVNVSLLNLSRYVNHLANYRAGAKPLKLGMDSTIYKDEIKPYFFIIEKLKDPISIKEMINYVSSKDEETKYKTNDNQLIDLIPSKELYFKINRENIKKEYQKDLTKIDSAVYIHLNKNYLTVAEFCMLDLIATNNFERPLYFAFSVGNESYMGLNQYFSNEALAYKISPLKTENEDPYSTGKVNSDILYSKLFEKLGFNKNNYKKNNLSKDQKRIINSYRSIFSTLANQLVLEKKDQKSVDVMDKCIDLFPSEFAPYNYNVVDFIRNYFKVSQTIKAKNLMSDFSKSTINDIEKFQKMKENSANKEEIQMHVYILNELSKIAEEFMPNEEFTINIQAKCLEYGNYIN